MKMEEGDEEEKQSERNSAILPTVIRDKWENGALSNQKWHCWFEISWKKLSTTSNL
jgi:hypothetical protein